MMDGFEPLTNFEPEERNKLRWLLRFADDNGIVEAGVAVKYGRQWYVNRERLPDFLRNRTLATLR